MNVSKFLSGESLHALDTVRAGIDRSFLDSVRDQFGGWGVTSQNLTVIGWTLAAACFAAGAIILINTYVIKRRSGLPSAGAVSNPSDIFDLFDEAIRQRSKIELSFSRTEGQAPSLNCSIEDVRNGHLDLEITTKVNAGPHWIGRTVTGHIRMSAPGAPDRTNFYNFTTEVAGLSKQADGSVRLSIPLPNRMRLQQKRIHLRLEPPQEFMLGLALWPDQIRKNGSPESNFKKWGKPALLFHAGKKDQMRLANISAGGVRLDVTRDALRDTGLQFEAGQNYILLAELYDPEAQRKDRLWCRVRVQNRFEDFETKMLELGIKFIAQGVLGGEKSKTIQWRKVGADGIDLIGNWVVKRHLEQFRKTSA